MSPAIGHSSFSIIGISGLQMRIALKTSIALIITAVVPMVLFFLIGALFVVSDIFSQFFSGTLQANLGDLLNSSIGLVLIDLFMVGPFSFGHVLFLGLPLLVVSWQFRAIRWWSTLLLSFIIGAVPTVLYWFFYITLRLEEGKIYFLQMQNMNISNLATTVILAIIMGGFGFSGGLAFWFLWRYWASPDSPHGRPLSELPKVEIKPLSQIQ